MDPTVKTEPTTMASANMDLSVSSHSHSHFKSHQLTQTDPKATPSTPKSETAPKQTTVDSDPDEQGSPTKKNKTKFPNKKSGPLGLIPTNYDEASETDRMLLRMKDSENRPWAEIGKALEKKKMIGASLKLNTVQVRYARMKANLAGFEKTDVCISACGCGVVAWTELTCDCLSIGTYSFEAEERD